MWCNAFNQFPKSKNIVLLFQLHFVNFSSLDPEKLTKYRDQHHKIPISDGQTSIMNLFPTVCEEFILDTLFMCS